MVITLLGVEPGLTGRVAGIEVTVMTRLRAGAVETFFFMTGITGRALIGELAVGSRTMLPADRSRNFASGRTEVTGVTTHSAAATSVVATVAGGARIDILRSDLTVIADAGRTDPGLANGVVGLKMAVMAGRRCLPVKTVFIMAGITGSLLVDLLRVPFDTVLPGHTFRNLAAIRAKMATVAAHSAAATFVIAAVTGSTAFNVFRRLQTMEGRTGLVQPTLSQRVLTFGMAIVAALGSVPIETILFVTGVADRHIGALGVMPGCPMFPAGVGG